QHHELTGPYRPGQGGGVQANAVGLAGEKDVFRGGDGTVKESGGEGGRGGGGEGGVWVHRVTLSPGTLAPSDDRRPARSATRRRAPSSSTVRRRALPDLSAPSWTGPRAIRRSRRTLCCSRASMRRISRFLPSLSTTRSQVLPPWPRSRLTERA